VDWKLIETHWPDLMRVALSVRAGRISSVTLLRRLGSESRRNRIYRALREVGRAVRTIVLLRYLSEPQLREGITAVTNRVEAFHGFADWLMFGREILAHNDPVHHEKTVKFNELLANSAMYSTAVDLMTEVNALIAAGRQVDPDDLAVVTPIITSKIRRFGDWKLDLTPPACGPVALALPTEPLA
jgi:TnpA family transposase